MNTLDIIKFMGERGGRFPKDSIKEIIHYFSNMIRDGRVVVIYKEKEIYAFVTFALTDEYERFYKKKTWDYVPHDKSGKIMYVEFMVCKQWNKQLRYQFQSEILKLYPQIEEAHWHRWASYGDRLITWRRKLYV